MLKVLLLILASRSALPGALRLPTSAVPARPDAADAFRDVLVGLQQGGRGLLADEAKAEADKQKRDWQPYELTDTGRKWGEYQAALARDLRSGSGEGQLKVLIVSAVADLQREVLLWEDSVKRLAATSGGHDDVFHWALFHHDGTTEWWAKSTRWTSSTGPAVVFNHVGPGCKLQNWGRLPAELTEQYDYIWLVDSDLRLDFFRWDLYRAVLTTLNPLVSQPSILPPFGGGQSSIINFLPIHSSCGEGFPVAMELPRTEVQAPMLSTKIWPAVRTRIRGGPGTTDWYMDSFWDTIAQHAKDSSCGEVGPVLVNAAPVWHQSWKTLQGVNQHKAAAGKCPQWKNANSNRRGVSDKELEEVKAALLSRGCEPANFPLSFHHLFSEQTHRGQTLCEARAGQGHRLCRKWVDVGAKGASARTCFTSTSEFTPAEVEFMKRGMVSANDTEHLIGGLRVGTYQGVPEASSAGP